MSPPQQSYSFPDGVTGGIDISQSADLIASNCSPDMVNDNYDFGVPNKRYGFDAINASWGTQDIQGQFEYEPTAGVYVHLVAWNGKLWSVAADGVKTDLCTGSKTSIADAQTDFFVMNGKCYFLTGTEYCYYDGTNPVAVVTGYVPTISLGGTPDGGGTPYEDLNYLSNSWIISRSGNGTATVYKLDQTGLSATPVLITVGGVALTENTHFTVDRTAGTVNFAAGTSPHGAPASGTDNVKIQPNKTGLMDATNITKCRFHQEYGGKDDTRIFVSGNPDVSNARYYSGLFDPTYFPENGITLIGSDSDEVSGMGRVSDYLLTFKNPKGIYNTDVESAETDIIFPVRPMNDDYGCCAYRTIQPAQGGLLALSYEGVVWCLASDVRGQLNARMISEKVNRGVGEVSGILDETLASLEAAHAVIWRNKYLLHVGSKTWVLDLDYSSLAQGVFCWYPYTGLFTDMTQFAVFHDGLLYAGNNAGTLYKSNDEYDDNGAAIDAWWTSPMFFGDKRFIKHFENLIIAYGNEATANHTLTIYTPDDAEDVTAVLEDTRGFDFDDIDFDDWTFGSSPYPSPINEILKVKDWYIQWKIRNSELAVGKKLLSQTLLYRVTDKEVS